MYNVLNEEDEKIRRCIDAFDFQRYGVPIGNIDLELRDKLLNSVLDIIGRCGQCSAFNETTSFCSTLKLHTEKEARCSDFEPGEEVERKSAFDVMMENFEQLPLLDVQNRETDEPK